MTSIIQLTNLFLKLKILNIEEKKLAIEIIFFAIE